MASNPIADALRHTLTSSEVPDASFGVANVVDVLAHLSNSARAIARAVTAPASPGHDESGGHVECLTEAVMGITAGLYSIASAIDGLAEAVRERG